ncbi:hypothetical protein QP185_15710 [Sphingomonas aerolata]|uniref:hypothetical protein n=1 Tax=Sphingomonas aerolata TaxID=185951 RepID=UPI002FE12BBD
MTEEVCDALGSPFEIARLMEYPDPAQWQRTWIASFLRPGSYNIAGRTLFRRWGAERARAQKLP